MYLKWEQEIFDVLGCQDVTKDDKDYNRVYKSDALSKYGFDMEKYYKLFRVQKNTIFFYNFWFKLS